MSGKSRSITPFQLSLCVPPTYKAYSFKARSNLILLLFLHSFIYFRPKRPFTLVALFMRSVFFRELVYEMISHRSFKINNIPTQCTQTNIRYARMRYKKNSNRFHGSCFSDSNGKIQFGWEFHFIIIWIIYNNNALNWCG